MSSAPLTLPVRASDAIALADIIFDAAERRPFRDDVRGRIGARLSAERFAGLRPYPGSLAQDPVHASAFFIAVDGADASPFLLRVALASAPASALFPNPVLITRSQSRAGRELVISAIPFAQSNSPEIRKFALEVDTAFLPRPHGVMSALTVIPMEPAVQLPAAFHAYRQILRSFGHKVASIDCSAGAPVLDAAVWAAVRGGWRDGFAASVRIPVGGADAANETIRTFAHASRFVLAAERADLDELDRYPERYAFIAETRAHHRPWKHFDFELSLAGSGVSAPDDVAFCLESLKRRGCPAQSIAPDLDGIVSMTELETRLAALAEAVRPFNAALTIHGRPSYSPAMIERIGRATGGRLNYEAVLPAGLSAEAVTDTITEMAVCLRG